MRTRAARASPSPAPRARPRRSRRRATADRGRPSRRRARRRQQQLRPRAAKRQHRHSIAPHVAIGEQQLDRALRLGQPMQRRRARGIDDEHRRGLHPGPKPRDPEILGTHRDPRSGALPQSLPGRGGAQGFHQVQPIAAARLAAPDPGRTASHAGLHQRAGSPRRARARRGTAFEQCEQPGRDGGLGGVQHDVVERRVARLDVARLDVARLGIGRVGAVARIGRGIGRLGRRRGRGQDRGARRQHQPAGERHVRLIHRLAPGQGGGGARHAKCQQRRPQRVDAERQRRRAERHHRILTGRHASQARPRRRDVGGPAKRIACVAQAQAGEVQVQRQAVEQRWRRPFIVRHALIERDHADPRRAGRGEAVARQHHRALVEHPGQPRRARR